MSNRRKQSSSSNPSSPGDAALKVLDIKAGRPGRGVVVDQSGEYLPVLVDGW